ncbi:hypothetical protein [Aminiphilus circumscriptus]|uniref:hypothetical protein n=1 Tax=Aminiphilus circumscriptus TaxID=290732 RepID=UPI0004BACC90|nr:hypothetical protein [Aminiphilus circumscriptus]
MSGFSVSDGPQPEEHLVSGIAVRAVLKGDREGFEAGGSNQLQPYGSQEQTHHVTVVDNFDGSAFVSQEARHVGHVYVGL